MIVERSSVHAHHDDASSTSATSGARAAAGCLDSGSTIAPRVTDDLVPKMVRRKLARCLRSTPLLVGSCTDESETDEEPPPRRRKAKTIKSGKTRTAYSTVAA